MSEKPYLLIEGVITLYQESDSNQSVPDDAMEPMQKMTVKLMDSGGGIYPVFNTSRWAVNDKEMEAISVAVRKVIKVLGGLSGQNRPVRDRIVRYYSASCDALVRIFYWLYRRPR